MNFKMRRSGGTRTVTIDGELTIQNSNELRDVLLKSLAGDGDVKLNLKGVTGADLSCLQLIHSANIAASKLKKSLKITGIHTGPFKKIVEDAGYSHVWDTSLLAT